jgi:hypothetical protein
MNVPRRAFMIKQMFYFVNPAGAFQNNLMTPPDFKNALICVLCCCLYNGFALYLDLTGFRRQHGRANRLD